MSSLELSWILLISTIEKKLVQETTTNTDTDSKGEVTKRAEFALATLCDGKLGPERMHDPSAYDDGLQRIDFPA